MATEKPIGEGNSKEPKPKQSKPTGSLEAIQFLGTALLHIRLELKKGKEDLKGQESDQQLWEPDIAVKPKLLCLF